MGSNWQRTNNKIHKSKFTPKNQHTVELEHDLEDVCVCVCFFFSQGCILKFPDYCCWGGNNLGRTPVGGFNDSWHFDLPKLGEMIQFDKYFFKRGWNHQLAVCWQYIPTSLSCINSYSPPKLKQNQTKFHWWKGQQTHWTWIYTPENRPKKSLKKLVVGRWHFLFSEAMLNLQGVFGGCFKDFWCIFPAPTFQERWTLWNTWMSQEVSKRLGSVGYNPNESPIYK